MTNAGIQKPIVTVLMSVYNGERFLREAIEGILDQTYEDFEFLIIDDGSKDSSSKIIRSYNDERIRLIEQKNHGFIYSLNKGVELAHGKYIARMDQDDISFPARLERQVKILDSNPRVGAVSTFFELINFEDSKPIGITMVFPNNNIDIKRALYIHNPMAHGSTTFRKEAWQQAGKYRDEYHPPEDYDLWRRIAQNWDLAIVPDVLFQYRINNPDSMSQRTIPAVERNLKKIHQELRVGHFYDKDLLSTFKDYRAYDFKLVGKYAKAVRTEYKVLQLNLAKNFLQHIYPLRAFVPTLFVVAIWPGAAFELLKLYPRSLAVNIFRRLKIKS